VTLSRCVYVYVHDQCVIASHAQAMLLAAGEDPNMVDRKMEISAPTQARMMTTRVHR
jgi:hypothetical protein